MSSSYTNKLTFYHTSLLREVLYGLEHAMVGMRKLEETAEVSSFRQLRGSVFSVIVCFQEILLSVSLILWEPRD